MTAKYTKEHLIMNNELRRLDKNKITRKAEGKPEAYLSELLAAITKEDGAHYWLPIDKFNEWYVKWHTQPRAPIVPADRPNFTGTPRRSRGLGDTIAKATKAVGIKPCGGCKKRQQKLNKMFPYKDKEQASDKQ